MNPYYLAIDIGASSGRHILAHLEDGKMVLEEVHRFPNGMVEKDGENSWDVDELFAQVKLGMKKCAQLGKIPVSVGVDTWGVDFVLLDGNGERIGNAVAYRDGRTKGMDEEVYKIISERDLYARTGIQKAIFNTIYQLMALKVRKPEQLAKAEVMLLMPDYFHYMLSGVAATEYTEATTGQMVSPETKDWDMELIEKLGYPKRIFQKMVTPGTVLGELTAEVQKEVGFNCKVVEPATHDTGSAVIAVPTDSDDALYISSGTWSLMGVELEEADCSEESRKANMTNEGGYEYRWRFLKNIMGLWMIQSVRHEYDDQYSFAQFCELAAGQAAFPSRVDVNDQRFLAPASMINAVKEACRETGQIVPKTCGELAAVIYRSLADSYHKAAQEIEHITGKTYSAVHIVGGGANADYLSRLTADSTGKTVYSGPSEATAIGNLIVQMIRQGEFASLSKAREAVAASFEIKKFEPVKY